MTRLLNLTGMTSKQIALVCTIGVVSIIAALLAAYLIRRWNRSASKPVISTAR